MTEIEKQEVINELLRQRKQFLGPQGCCVKSETRNRFTARCFSAAITSICKVSEYEKAESEGLLVVLPCNIGRTVYIVDNGKIHRCFTENTLVRNGLMARVMETNTDTRYVVYPEDIGKTVFLTRAEAEAAVSGGERNG